MCPYEKCLEAYLMILVPYQLVAMDGLIVKMIK